MINTEDQKRRQENWEDAESARRVAPGTSCTHCRSYSYLRFTVSGVYCYDCYMKLDTCEAEGCSEPQLKGESLCRSHWQLTFENGDPDRMYHEAIRCIFHPVERNDGGARLDLCLNAPVLKSSAKPCPGGPYHIYQPGARTCNCGARTIGRKE